MLCSAAHETKSVRILDMRAASQKSAGLFQLVFQLPGKKPSMAAVARMREPPEKVGRVSGSHLSDNEGSVP
jgi:hypothetical protein